MSNLNEEKYGPQNTPDSDNFHVVCGKYEHVKSNFLVLL